jgi:flagellin-like protein
MPRRAARAVSPVVATILLVALVILLVSMLMVALGNFDFLSDREPDFAAAADTGRGVIVALDDRSGAASARHKVVFPVPEGTSLDGDSLNSVRIDYLNDSADTSGVSQGDVLAAGIDTDGDRSIDTNVSSDLSGVDGREGGDRLYVGFGGNYGLTGGDNVVVVFDGVENPSTGVYPASVYLNDYRKLARLGTIQIEP